MMNAFPLSENINLAYYEQELNKLAHYGDCLFEKQVKKIYNWEQYVPVINYIAKLNFDDDSSFQIDLEILDNQFNNTLITGNGLSRINVQLTYDTAAKLPNLYLSETSYFSKFFRHSGLFRVKSKNKEWKYFFKNNKNLYDVYLQANELADYSPVLEVKELEIGSQISIHFNCRITAKIEMEYWYELIQDVHQYLLEKR